MKRRIPPWLPTLVLVLSLVTGTFTLGYVVAR